MSDLMFDIADFGVCRKILREILITADRLLEVARSAFKIERIRDRKLR
jgi:hypothetical protein